jgi:hypothetical protein
MENAISELLKNMAFGDCEMPHFPKEGYTSVKISKENFHEIKREEPKTDSSRKIAFIDAGNQEICGAHNFSLQLIRAYYSIYQNNKRIEKGTYEAYALISARKKEKSLFFDVKMFFRDKSLKIDNISFDAYDETLSAGKRMVKVEVIGDEVRKFIEFSLAKNICEKIENGFIILDTTLEATVNGEKKLFDSLYEKAVKNKVTVAALSKTTSLLTESGNSAIAILNQLSPDGEWYYHPLVKIDSPFHKAQIMIVKLHEKSKYVFRLEINKGQENEIGELLSVLLENSKDPVFLGYPYGLIEADRNARVSNREVDVKQTQLFIKLGRDFEKLKNYLNTKNAHNILDNIS